MHFFDWKIRCENKNSKFGWARKLDNFERKNRQFGGMSILSNFDPDIYFVSRSICFHSLHQLYERGYIILQSARVEFSDCSVGLHIDKNGC